MAITSRFTNWAAELHTLTAQSVAAVTVDGVQGIDLNPQLVSALEQSDGSEFNTFTSLASGSPRATFRTTDLPALLDECSSFMLVDSDGTHPGIRLFLQAYADGAARAATGAVLFTFADGILVLRQLQLSHQQSAIITAEVIGKSTDGLISPVAIATAQALPAVFPTTDVLFTLGKVDLDGTILEGLESVSIDFGIEVAPDAKDSNIYPSFTAIERIQPLVTIRGIHIDDLATITADGLFSVASTVIIYARKRALGAKFVADGVAEHVSFTLGRVRTDWANVTGSPKTVDLILRPIATPGGSPVLPIAVNTATVIP